MYAVVTHVNAENPCNCPTIVGIAVATMVWSSALRNIATRRQKTMRWSSRHSAGVRMVSAVPCIVQVMVRRSLAACQTPGPGARTILAATTEATLLGVRLHGAGD